ncbi:anthranilate synthase component 1 [Moritella marina ATCC 15381]|uniref:Anthranilate synthase component 1 n=1 Tax=Moritella marina ATCC 15381 TaxID=1202962 RepID=A0A5J6WKT2_MORMI|nr:anthranilate synthase component 1 [Moritella marina]QFI38607.1 anthranilate synthase component 1 [Moritella marina ATCC 15381]
MTQRLAPGKLHSIQQDCPHIDDPLAFYRHMYRPSGNSLLLESADIVTKTALQSLILLDAAVKISCFGRTVQFNALTKNGENLLPFLADEFTAQFGADTVTSQEDHQLALSFAPTDDSLDEDSRLQSSSPFDALRTIINRVIPETPFHEALFLGGCFAYDMIASVESLPKVPDGANICPDFVFYVAETLIVIDRQTQQSKLIGSVFGGEHFVTALNETEAKLARIQTECATVLTTTPASKAAELTLKVDISDSEFCSTVEDLKDYIRKGDIFQVVPSRCFNLPCPDSLAAYEKLKQTNASPYMFYLNDSDFVLFGASPESALKYDAQSNDVEIYPIAGTRRRGFRADGSICPDLDGRIELELRQDKKETAEHIMLVDLARNDVARISQPGTRYVANLLNVDRYSYVMHLVSRVKGKLRHDLDALHAYQACMNMGTLVGAPKIRAAELVRQVEQQRRGSYGGAVGYLTGDGTMDTCIVIRSAFVKDEMAYVQAGAGVVYDSNPQAEADETRSKAAAVLNAVALAQGSSLAAIMKAESMTAQQTNSPASNAK